MILITPDYSNTHMFHHVFSDIYIFFCDVFQAEFVEFLSGTKAALTGFDSSPKGDIDQFNYWDSSNYAREKYRYLTNTTFSGEFGEVSTVRACAFNLLIV